MNSYIILFELDDLQSMLPIIQVGFWFCQHNNVSIYSHLASSTSPHPTAKPLQHTDVTKQKWPSHIPRADQL